MKKFLKPQYITLGVIGILVLGLIIYTFTLNNNNHSFSGNYAFAKASVDKITFDNVYTLKNAKSSSAMAKQEFQITILDGKHAGEKYKIRNSIEALDVRRIIVSEGDEILVNYTLGKDGKMNSIHVYEIVRDKYIYILIAIFVVSIIAICGKKGMKSVASLIFTGFMIIKILMPIIMSGANALAATIIVSVITAAAVIFFINGLNKKSVAAALGTLGGIIVSAVIAVIIGNACKVTGITGNEAETMAYVGKSMNLNYKYILFSAIIIGSLGAIMDVSMSICSAMNELIEVKPNIDKKELIKSGMNIGKDIMATMANTLILAYAGGAFNLFLLFIAERVTYTEIINMEVITADIINAFAGSIGLVWTMPITIFIMASLKNLSMNFGGENEKL
ncbi:YibE/F family protein [Clostridium neuense]|uniref:YibE/F family protein n=1 Tax=Clostridium neuense TaxID=1728934 RepID=A0ABW8TA58_9CLOT